jgi:hypothetical protein
LSPSDGFHRAKRGRDFECRGPGGKQKTERWLIWLSSFLALTYFYAVIELIFRFCDAHPQDLEISRTSVG